MAIRKVLVVDDSKTELLYLTDLLQKKGMQVRSTCNPLPQNIFAIQPNCLGFEKVRE